MEVAGLTNANSSLDKGNNRKVSVGVENQAEKGEVVRMVLTHSKSRFNVPRCPPLFGHWEQLARAFVRLTTVYST